MSPVPFRPGRAAAWALLGTVLPFSAAAAAPPDDGPPPAAEILPTSRTAPQLWRYTLQPPPPGWEKPGFDDSAWSRGPGGFGTRGTPAAVVRTEWRTSDLWLRREFRLDAPPPAEIRLLIHHDDDAEVFLNGVPAARLGGCTSSYETVPLREAARRTLRPGTNLIAIHVRQLGGGQYLDAGLVRSGLGDGDLRSAIFQDWLLQDARDSASPFASETDSAAEKNAVENVLRELGGSGRPLRAELDRLVSERIPGRDPRWKSLYVRAAEARREARLRPLLSRVRRIVFAKHWNLGGSHYAYTECLSDAQDERHWVPGSALCLLEQDGLYGEVRTLLEDPGGIIRNPDVTWDGTRIVFSWKKDDRKDDYHLYEYDPATRNVRPLTEGLGFADTEPCCLPNGDIVFSSTRCVQTVDCWWTEVSNLYRCDRNGRFLRRLGFDQVHTNFPTATPDGRILYTRWEYNDRGQIFPQPLFQMNPDGTGQTECYGNNSWFPTTILHARAIPGTDLILAVATGHHSDQSGKLILIDPSRGRQENRGVQLVAPRRPTPAERIDAYGQDGDQFQYPYPIDENHFLVTYAPLNPGRAGRNGFGIYFMDLEGRRELLAWDPKLSCNQPVPLVPRPRPPVRPDAVDYRKTTGTCYVQDVHHGPGLRGVPRGTVKALRVVALEYRAAGIGWNGNGGPGGGALISTPVAVGNGTWDVKIILGTAPVEEDGSAYFRVPARTPLYFQLLDARGYVVQTMRSWATLQPGENASCTGCHESKNEAPPLRKPPMALRRPASELRPFYGPPRGFSFNREIQPILDRKCITCHAGEPAKPLDLTSRPVPDPGAKRRWSASYLALTHAAPDEKTPPSRFRGKDSHPLVNWISAQSAPPMLPPYSAGAARSRLLEMLESGHEGVSLTREELEKIAAWIDLGVPFCGDYREAHAWTPDEVERYNRFLEKRRRMEAIERENLEALLRNGRLLP